MEVLKLADQLVRLVATVFRQMIHDMLAQAVERGEIRADIDLEATTRIVHTLTIAVADSQLLPYLNTYFQVSDEDVVTERILEALLALIWRGIGTREGE